MMKHKKAIALVLAALMAVGAFTASAYAVESGKEPQTSVEETVQTHRRGHRKKEKVAEPENAIGKDAAKQAALKDAGVTEDQVEKIKARTSKLDDGTVVYKVGFTAGDKYYSYKINALTGAVEDKSEMTAEEHAAAKENRKGERRGKAQQGSEQTDAGEKTA